MVSGRGAVSKGWSRLSDDVRCGPLSNSDGSGPNRRALRPLIRRLFRDYKVSVLASADNALEEHYDPETVVERIAGADSWLRQVGLLLDGVKSELVLRQVTDVYDPMFTLTIAEVPGPDEESDEESSAKLVLSICDRLTCDESRSVAALKRLFDDPVQHDRMARDLENAWALRHDGTYGHEGVDDYRAHLDAYLAAVAFDSMGKPAVAQWTGQESWALAVDLDASGGMLQNLSAVGLSAYPAQVRPALDGGGHLAPLDQSIYQRLWSVLKGAAGRKWLRALPELPEMASLEIGGSARPFGMRTAGARAGLSAGVRAYAAITPDEPARLLRDQPGAVGYLNRKVATFLSAVGGFARLDATAQDHLSNPERALIPGLWTKLHNAEYRLDVSTSPTWVWGQIAGEVETLIREIKQRQTKSQVGVSNLAWGTGGPTQRRQQEPVTVVDGERDGRVRDAMSRLTHVRGREALEEVLRMRDEEARGVWEQAAGSIASWVDLLGYLDNHLPRG
jgi:hypothetical protein